MIKSTKRERINKAKAQRVKFGSIYIEKGIGKTPFIPKSMTYKEHGQILETVAFAIKEDLPVLLIGETGVGKTSAIRHIASKTNNSLRRVNVNGSMTAEDFVGQLLVNEKGTFWKDGVLTEAMRKGYWIVIDEINGASAEILFVLHSLLDDDKYIVLTDHPEREIVPAHKNFRIFATMNPPERYAGTKELNKALLSRFALTITVPIPPSLVEYGTISNADKILPEQELKSFKAFVTEMRASYDKEDLDVFISPRDIGNIMRVFKFTQSLAKAIALTITPRGTNSEQEAITNLVNLHFAKKKMKN